MDQGARLNKRTSATAIVRIRPGRMIFIRPPLLRTLGADPKRLMVLEEGNRLVISTRPSPQEARLARFKARLAGRGSLRVTAIALHSGGCIAPKGTAGGRPGDCVF